MNAMEGDIPEVIKMNKYRVEFIHTTRDGETRQSTILEADSTQDARMIVKIAADVAHTGTGRVEITEVKEYRVEWIEMHAWQGHAIDEDDAERAAVEYSKTHNTFDDHCDFDVEEIESTASMIRNGIEREPKKSPKFADIPFYHMSNLTPPNVYMVVCPCIEVSNDIKQHYDSMTSKYTYGIYEVLSDD